MEMTQQEGSSSNDHYINFLYTPQNRSVRSNTNSNASNKHFYNLRNWGTRKPQNILKLRVGFLNIEDIWKAIGNWEICNIIKDKNILGIAELWMNNDVNPYLKGFVNYNKHRKKINKFGRTPGGLKFFTKKKKSSEVVKVDYKFL